MPMTPASASPYYRPSPSLFNQVSPVQQQLPPSGPSGRPIYPHPSAPPTSDTSQLAVLSSLAIYSQSIPGQGDPDGPGRMRQPHLNQQDQASQSLPHLATMRGSGFHPSRAASWSAGDPSFMLGPDDDGGRTQSGLPAPAGYLGSPAQMGRSHFGSETPASQHDPTLGGNMTGPSGTSMPSSIAAMSDVPVSGHGPGSLTRSGMMDSFMEEDELQQPQPMIFPLGQTLPPHLLPSSPGSKTRNLLGGLTAFARLLRNEVSLNLYFDN